MVLGLVERLAEAVVQGSAVITCVFFLLCVIVKNTLIKFIGLWSVSVVDIERNDFIIHFISNSWGLGIMCHIFNVGAKHVSSFKEPR